MEDFALPPLPLALLERVITKFDWKSYFRLQQTCHQMEELIQANKNIRTDGDAARFVAEPRQIEGEDGEVKEPLEICTYFDLKFKDTYRNATCLYGVRFKEIAFDEGVLEHKGQNYFEEYYSFLKEHRFSCNVLGLNCRDLTMEQRIRLLKLLKPTKIGIYYDENGIEFGWFDVLLQQKQLEFLSSHIDLDCFLSLPLGKIENILAHFQHVEFYATGKSTRSKSPQFVKSIVKVLQSISLPNLRKLYIRGGNNEEGPTPLPPVDELLKMFAGLNVTVKKHSPGVICRLEFDLGREGWTLLSKINQSHISVTYQPVE